VTFPFVDRELARRFELAAAHRSVEFARSMPDAQIQSNGDASFVYAGSGMPTNRAIGLGLMEPVAREQVDDLESFYHHCGSPARVDVCPLADRSLIEILGQRGYRVDLVLNMLFRPVNDLAAQADTEIEVRPVGETELPLWQHTAAQGFSGQEEPPSSLVNIIAATGHSASAALFLAWVGAFPAGGGAYVLHTSPEGKIAELCSASTRIEFRRRGVQTALLHYRLQAAQKAGCDYVTVLTEPGSASQRNVERAGFRLAYTRFILKKEGAPLC
jgi:ribosomal protein S18 acetylase RimI-like enzyme